MSLIQEFNNTAQAFKQAKDASKESKSLANKLAWDAARVYALGTIEDRAVLKASIAKGAVNNFAKSYVSRAKKAVIYFVTNKESIVTTATGLEVNAESFKTMIDTSNQEIALHAISKAIDTLTSDNEELTEQDIAIIGQKSLKMSKDDLLLGGQSAFQVCLDEGNRIIAEKQHKQSNKVTVESVIAMFNKLTSEEQLQVTSLIVDAVNEQTLEQAA